MIRDIFALFLFVKQQSSTVLLVSCCNFSLQYIVGKCPINTNKYLYITNLHYLWGFCIYKFSYSIKFMCCYFSVAQSCLTLCDPVDYSMAGFPVLHYLWEFAQTHVHWVNDAIQPFYPVSPPSPPKSILIMPPRSFMDVSTTAERFLYQCVHSHLKASKAMLCLLVPACIL